MSYAKLHAALVLWLSFCLSSASAQRVALVVGNDQYRYAIPLHSPANDAADIGHVLKEAGYGVDVFNNTDRRHLADALAGLERRGRGAEVCFFYFSGHGLEVGGQNYLLPINGRIAGAGDVDAQTIPLESVLASLRATNALRKIVVLDCCRSNPFANVRGSQVGPGLASVPESSFPPGTLIVFAGAPGREVPDGVGRNSPFTEELLRQMKPGRDTLSLFAAVAGARFEVQDPWIKFDGSGASFADLRTYDFLSSPRGAASGPTVPAARVPNRIASYWDHNGSTVGLLANEQRRTFIYVKVRAGLADRVEPGMVLFDGVASGEEYQGKARRFFPGRPPIAYAMAGPITREGTQVILRGKAPVRAPDGRVERFMDERLIFDFLKLAAGSAPSR